MSSSYNSTTSTILLRRPRPSNLSTKLPPLLSQLSTDIDQSSRSGSATQRPMPSVTSHQDGMQSPVPTMQSEFDSVYGKKQTSNATAMSVDTGGDTGTFSKQGLVLPYKPRGPDAFPMREPKKPLDVKREYLLPIAAKPSPEFVLEDFLLTNKCCSPQRPALRKAILSKSNYKKLTKLLQQSMQPDHNELAKISLHNQLSVQIVPKRIPRRQLLIEMKTIIQDKLKECGITSPSHLDSRADALTKVIEEVQEMGDNEGISRKSQMDVFQSATERVLKSEHKSISSFEAYESIITPAELAILNCLVEGGYVLSLKAHFIYQVPDLNPLAHTLVYINLSFNEFEDFPREVLVCRELQVLKLRDNPLREIPQDISRLQKLRTLILSFCCLMSLPISLFSLTKLEFLDVSFNKLTFIPNEIKNLEKLRFLNTEGNELPGLPCGLLRLNLFRIRIRNNFMSPLFWKENSQNSSQRLVDMCLLVLQRNVIGQTPENTDRLPPEINRALNSFRRCDCCLKPMYGHGLRVIRPCSEIWGIKRIPFIFNSCSPTCCKEFIQNVDPRITEIIYGVDEKLDSNQTKNNTPEALSRVTSPRDGAITA